MNELIEKLVEQARKYANEYVEDEVEKQFHKKFAQLIAKETLQVARAGIEFGDGMEDAVYKYFGIEE